MRGNSEPDSSPLHLCKHESRSVRSVKPWKTSERELKLRIEVGNVPYDMTEVSSRFAEKDIALASGLK